MSAEVDFKGVIDLIENRALGPDGDRDQALVEISIPDSDKEKAKV